MSAPRNSLEWSVLNIDAEAEAQRISQGLREIVSRTLNRRGLVVAVSGGIDSSACLALAVKALGAGRVFALMLPERDSSPDSTARGIELADHLGVQYLVADIEPALDGIGCYQWRDEAVRRVVPEYGRDWRMKIVIAGGSEGQFNRFKLIVENSMGCRQEHRLPLREYLQIVAATNFKQRLRKTLEYFHADRLNFAVVGTPNRLEYDQGFFVKNGDGSADVKPIAHLYKSQVYALARHLGLPERICNAVPTTDTYSLQQGQDEFYFALPYQQMDIALWAHNHAVQAQELARFLSISVEQARWIFDDIDAKRRATKYMHLPPVLIESVSETAQPD